MAVAGVITLASYQVMQGTMQIGDVIGFITAAIIGATSTRSWHAECCHQEAAAAGRRIFELIDTENKIKDDTNATAFNAAKAELSFSDVNLSIGEPQLLLTSPSSRTWQNHRFGRAKRGGQTSIINLVPRFVDATSGAIAINGQDIRGMTIDSLRAHIALVSQAVIFDDTVAANIAFGKSDASRDDIMKAAKDAAAHDLLCHWNRAMILVSARLVHAYQAVKNSALPLHVRS